MNICVSPMFDHTLLICLSSLSSGTTPYSTSSALSFSFFLFLLIYLSFSLSLYLPVWPICLYSLSRPMATLALIRTGDESSTVFAAVCPARGSAACARPVSSRVSVYIFIKIVEYMFAIKTPWTTKKHTNEKQSSWYWYRIYNKYLVTYFFKILFVEHSLFCFV